MSVSKQKKQKKKQNTSLSEKFRKGWKSRYPVQIFVAVFALLMGGFYLLWFNDKIHTTFFEPLTYFYARWSSKILNLFNYGTQVFDATIFSSAFSISIKRGCDAIEGIALFVCAVLAFPSSFKNKLVGLAFGIAALFLLNFIRIISLFMIGISYPSLFELMHWEVWQVIFIIVALILWLLWMRYIALRVKPATDAQYKTHS